MTAIRRDIYLEQGATWRLGFTYSHAGPLDDAGQPTAAAPYDFSDATARMQIRDKPGGTVLVEVTSSDGITLGGSAGTVEILISDVKTDALGPLERAKKGVYDLEIAWAGGDVTRLLQGKAVIDPNVTRNQVTA